MFFNEGKGAKWEKLRVSKGKKRKKMKYVLEFNLKKEKKINDLEGKKMFIFYQIFPLTFGS